MLLLVPVFFAPRAGAVKLTSCLRSHPIVRNRLAEPIPATSPQRGEENGKCL